VGHRHQLRGAERPLKDTSIRATYTAHRASKAQADGSLDEFRW
jgi:hypothetical protein